MGDQIEALCQSGSVINAIGGTSLKGVLALIDNARAVIAPDTGPAHMGNAMGTPTLGLYATTNPQRAAPYLWRDFAVDAYPDAVRTYLHKSVDEVSWGAAGAPCRCDGLDQSGRRHCQVRRAAGAQRSTHHNRTLG